MWGDKIRVANVDISSDKGGCIRDGQFWTECKTKPHDCDGFRVATLQCIGEPVRVEIQRSRVQGSGQGTNKRDAEGKCNIPAVHPTLGGNLFSDT